MSVSVAGVRACASLPRERAKGGRCEPSARTVCAALEKYSSRLRLAVLDAHHRHIIDMPLPSPRGRGLVALAANARYILASGKRTRTRAAVGRRWIPNGSWYQHVSNIDLRLSGLGFEAHAAPRRSGADGRSLVARIMAGRVPASREACSAPDPGSCGHRPLRTSLAFGVGVKTNDGTAKRTRDVQTCF